jgi:polysaccharide export outer membrane protein
MRVSAKSWAAKSFATLAAVSALALTGCATSGRSGNLLPPAGVASNDADAAVSENYIIGALDEITVFVWRNSELSVHTQVRPDGRITTPLISDMVAAGKTPSQLADDIRSALSQYIQEPLVSVMVDRPQGSFSQQVRIVGATARPAAIPYRANMTLLDAMIAVGGLSEFAAGDRARLVRVDRGSGQQREYDLRIASLLRRGDVRANVRLEPGDVIIIPESMF